MASTVPGEVVSHDEIFHQAKQNHAQRERAAHMPHADLMSLAKARPPNKVAAVVTSFSDWVFNLDKDSFDDSEAKSRGKAGELVLVNGVFRDLTQLKQEKWQRIQAKKKQDMGYYAGKRFSSSEWVLEFDGTGDSEVEALQISSLQVANRPLFGKPDLVFRHKRTGDVLILELKTWNGHGRLPPFGWPNMKAQLWCYGLADAWRDAPNVLLQGRVWRWLDRPTMDQPDADAGLQHPGIALQPWLASDPRVHSECVELFTLFGGQCHSKESAGA
ncbi:MAG: hypothetical protein L0Z53_16000 [Acidobacteriales bacterium]|nr:hypothetical protein [Terriglobales bacterium]